MVDIIPQDDYSTPELETDLEQSENRKEGEHELEDSRVDA